MEQVTPKRPEIRPLRFAWLTPVILREAAACMGLPQAEGGTWLDTLFDQLRIVFDGRAEFSVIHPSLQVTKVLSFSEGNVTYHLVPKRKFGFKDRYRAELADIQGLLSAFNPDLIHIHGSEEFYGLAAKNAPGVPVLSLQGFREDIQRNYWTDISFWQFAWLNLKRGKKGWIRKQTYLRRMIDIEREIFAVNRNFIGRTDYDRYHALSHQPEGRYFGECHDILRQRFYEEAWNGDEAEPFTLHTTVTERPYKGILFLIRMVDLLRKRYPQVKLTIAGSMQGVIGKYARQYVQKNGLEQHVSFLGRCNSDQLIAAMKRASVFVLGSFVENESLSLQEAQALGMPCVAPWLGGVASMFTPEEEGLYFPKGDARYLAGVIARLFEDPDSARKMGQSARSLCQRRNDPELIGQRYEKIYLELCASPVEALNVSQSSLSNG